MKTMKRGLLLSDMRTALLLIAILVCLFGCGGTSSGESSTDQSASDSGGGTGVSGLTVTLSPQGATDAGGRWSVDEGASWNPSEANLALPAGDYSLRFTAIAGYETPAALTVTVVAGEAAMADATYVEQTRERTVGLFLNLAEASPGYTLFAPMGSGTTYLINNFGDIVNSWESSYDPGLAAYLLENGNLLRTGNLHNATFSSAGGAGGIVEEFDPDNNLVWSYRLSAATACLHHDLEILPDGHILLIAWELKSESEALAAGRNPALLADGELWPDTIIEIDPATNNIVWQWHVWDHLVQDYDSAKPNYAAISDHPELVDLNFTETPLGGADWTHINSVAYNEEFDQILLSVHAFSEVWVIDHSTTTAEAASHSGGASGQGGDLLYRWGNPQAYARGTASDRVLYGQHDANWIAAGTPGAGNILLFNNGLQRPSGAYSSIEEFTPPVDQTGDYTLQAGGAYGPDTTVWTYTTPTPEEFYASNISGAQRLANGNTLVCEGKSGTIFELTPADELVWKFVNPVTASGMLGTTDDIPTNPRGEQQNQVFKVRRYAPDYPGCAGY
jgi:hypothetical protein